MIRDHSKNTDYTCHCSFRSAFLASDRTSRSDDFRYFSISGLASTAFNLARASIAWAHRSPSLKHPH